MVGEVVHVSPFPGDLASEQEDWQQEEITYSCDQTTQAAKEEVVSHTTHDCSVRLARFVKEQAILTCLYISEAGVIVVFPSKT